MRARSIAMSYPAGHKERTRARILEHASRLFRQHGYGGVGIDSIMEAAGLTRGGFYAHFASKDDLFAAVTALEGDFVRRLRTERVKRVGRRDRTSGSAGAVIAGYLAPANREKIALGCNMAALTEDVARGPRAARAGYTRMIRDLTSELEAHLPSRAPAATDRCLTTIALCLGGIAIARAVDDEALARRVLRVCKERALGEMSED